MKSKEKTLAPVTVRALKQRIDRKLLKGNKRLVQSTGGPECEQLGDFYVVDLTTASVAESQVDLEKYGRKLKALKPWETLQG